MTRANSLILIVLVVLVLIASALLLPKMISRLPMDDLLHMPTSLACDTARARVAALDPEGLVRLHQELRAQYLTPPEFPFKEFRDSRWEIVASALNLSLPGAKTAYAPERIDCLFELLESTVSGEPLLEKKIRLLVEFKYKQTSGTFNYVERRLKQLALENPKLFADVVDAVSTEMQVRDEKIAAMANHLSDADAHARFLHLNPSPTRHHAELLLRLSPEDQDRKLSQLIGDNNLNERVKVALLAFFSPSQEGPARELLNRKIRQTLAKDPRMALFLTRHLIALNDAASIKLWSDVIQQAPTTLAATDVAELNKQLRFLLSRSEFTGSEKDDLLIELLKSKTILSADFEKADLIVAMADSTQIADQERIRQQLKAFFDQMETTERFLLWAKVARDLSDELNQLVYSLMKSEPTKQVSAALDEFCKRDIYKETLSEAAERLLLEDTCQNWSRSGAPRAACLQESGLRRWAENNGERIDSLPACRAYKSEVMKRLQQP